MIDDLLERIVKDKMRAMSLTDKLTGFLVKKKRRGTYQAMEESKFMEEELTNSVVQFVNAWLINETVDGFIKKELEKTIMSQVQLELSSKGFNKVEV